MSLLALASALLDRPMHRRFLSDPRIRASLLLLQERIPLAEVRTRIDTAPEQLKLAAQEPSKPRCASSRPPTRRCPEVHLLSNGRYHVMITAAGSGYSRWEDLALTRWQEDATRDHWGTFLYVRDLASGSALVVDASADRPPSSTATKSHFSQGVAEFRSVREKTSRCGHARGGVVRRRRRTAASGHHQPRSATPATCEITSYAEVAMLNGANASEQPAFNGLFIEAETLPAKAAVLCTRRTRSPQEDWPCFFHGMMVHDVAGDRGRPSRRTAPASWAAAERRPIPPPWPARTAVGHVWLRCSIQ